MPAKTNVKVEWWKYMNDAKKTFCKVNSVSLELKSETDNLLELFS